jgi:hypothetical protein
MTAERPVSLAQVKADWLRVQSEMAWVRMLVASWRLRDALKRELAALRNQDQLGFAAKYSPDQPRISAGQSGGGQWTDDGGDGRVLTDATPDTFLQPWSQTAQNEPDNLPKLPDQKPLTPKECNQIVKQVARVLAKAGQKVIPVARAASWVYEFSQYINAYLDLPKDLSQLQDAVSEPATGYNIHHIVEQTAAENEGYSRDLIDGRDNLVRVPTLKHWEITGWYARRNKEFSMQAPRDYLRGKSWDEKMAIGRKTLVDHGVLKP